MIRKARRNAWFYEAFKIPKEVPVFPLPETPLFPGIELPLYIFEPRYQQMLADAHSTHKFIAVALLRARKDSGREPVCHEIAGLGYIRVLYENGDGTSYILLKGIRRIRILRYMQMRPYRIAEIRALPDTIENAAELHRLARRLKELLTQKIRFLSENPEERLALPRECNNPLILSHVASFLITADQHLKQGLLETVDSKSRIRHLIRLLEEEIYPPASSN